MTQHYTLKNNLTLTLREATPDDAEHILGHMEQTSGESENLTRGPGDLDITIEEERDFLQACADSPTGLYLLAEIAGELAGILSFQTGKRPRVCHVGEFGITVLRKYWGLSIGGYMLAYLIDWAKVGGIVRKINLLVRTDNLPAIHLYEKYGFVREGCSTRDMYIGGQFVDCYLMGLEIDPSVAEA
ncbi:MAG: GNAT family N-acetyltransferase [Ktedonobacteraceae bacterium]